MHQQSIYKPNVFLYQIYGVSRTLTVDSVSVWSSVNWLSEDLCRDIYQIQYLLSIQCESIHPFCCSFVAFSVKERKTRQKKCCLIHGRLSLSPPELEQGNRENRRPKRRDRCIVVPFACLSDKHRWGSSWKQTTTTTVIIQCQYNLMKSRAA